MKMTTRSVLVNILLFFFSTAAICQQVTIESGIKWTEGLSWKEVREKAKKENKYIFLDCFTTWCGPCKQMDKTVYNNEKVAAFFNDRFISVKVQMDQAKEDNAYTKSWYEDVENIAERYMIEGYPSFLFFSPEGMIVHKGLGAMIADSLIELAQTALRPGKTYEDLYARFQRLLEEFHQGTAKKEDLPLLVTIARKKGDTVSRKILRVHESYVSKLTKELRYTKANIEFWSTLNLTPDRNIVQFFYKDGKRINKVMGKEGYSDRQVDKAIQAFIAGPFLDENLTNDAKSRVATLDVVTGAQVSNATNYNEADWKKLRKLIRKQFNKRVTERNIIKAKAVWYEKNSNWISFAKAVFGLYKNSPPDIDDFDECYNINNVGWNVFLHVNDEPLMKESLVWMQKLVEKEPLYYDALDTYANLLYKFGQKDEAIRWQQKVVGGDPSNLYRQKALEQMKKGEFTYGVKW